LLRDALRYDPTNDGIVRLLYQLYLVQENPGQASQILKNYSESLAREKFPAAEIKEIVDDFKKTPVVKDWFAGD
jgi:hypothetical protein